MDTSKELVKLNAEKSDKIVVDQMVRDVHNVFHEFEVKLESFRKDQLVLEHYTERYVPAQI